MCRARFDIQGTYFSLVKFHFKPFTHFCCKLANVTHYVFFFGIKTSTSKIAVRNFFLDKNQVCFEKKQCLGTNKHILQCMRCAMFVFCSSKSRKSCQVWEIMSFSQCSFKNFTFSPFPAKSSPFCQNTEFYPPCQNTEMAPSMSKCFMYLFPSY